MFYLFCLLFFFANSLFADVYGEYIHSGGERFFVPPPPVERTVRSYSWRGKQKGGIFRITKDFFRCKGEGSHPLIVEEKEGKKVYIRDCVGGEKHGLPVREGREYIYPCLVDLLNYVQEKTGKRVVITTGHRCPTHNAYADRSSENKLSKHMLGAEVDFYVEGMEREAEKVISYLLAFYREKKDWGDDYVNFQRGDATKYHLTVSPWMNKEIVIKLNLENEGRDFDNQHEWPYVTIQVRYDRELGTKVFFDEKLIYQYLRN